MCIRDRTYPERDLWHRGISRAGHANRAGGGRIQPGRCLLYTSLQCAFASHAFGRHDLQAGAPGDPAAWINNAADIAYPPI